MACIVHLVWRDSYDKFPVGYINFMKLRMTEYEHHFLLKTSDNTGTIHGPLPLCSNDNVYYYDDLLHALFTPANFRLLRKCDKIIISGWLLTAKTRAFLLMSGLASKTYLHFWAANFEEYKPNIIRKLRHPRSALRRFIQHQLIKKCAGTINLIQGDLDVVMLAFPNNTKHFIAPMPSDPLKQYDFAPLRARPKQGSAYRIIVGHSSNILVRHAEAFRLLEHLKSEDIEIICPLSYGDFVYREEIIAEGRHIFGEKFKPVTEFMSKPEYYDLLASCDCGVFTTDTQQGMGNILILLRLGKKVFIREDTSMWPNYTQTRGFTLYPVSQLEGITMEQLKDFPQEVAYNNAKIADEYAAGNQAVEQWRKVFDD